MCIPEKFANILQNFTRNGYRLYIYPSKNFIDKLNLIKTNEMAFRDIKGMAFEKAMSMQVV
jgi:hypothetical protein